jgi:ADP-heptose:LPS heptosyltransferase
VERVITHELPWIASDPRPLTTQGVDALIADVRRLHPDEGIVFTSFHQSPLPTALVLRLAGVPRIGAISIDYPGSLLDVRHQVPDHVHEVERALSLAAAMGCALPPGDDARLAVDVSGSAPRIGEGDAPLVVVHPGASVPARSWAPERARHLVRELVGRGYRVAVTGAPGDRELTASVTAGTPGVSDLGGATTFHELAALLRDACVVVSGNTGPAHLAAAVGTAVVSLFAATIPASRWRPWGVPHRLLGHHDVACAGCRARQCPVPGHPCLDVAADEVAAAVDDLARPSLADAPAPSLAEMRR